MSPVSGTVENITDFEELLDADAYPGLHPGVETMQTYCLRKEIVLSYGKQFTFL